MNTIQTIMLLTGSFFLAYWFSNVLIVAIKGRAGKSFHLIFSFAVVVLIYVFTNNP